MTPRPRAPVLERTEGAPSRAAALRPLLIGLALGACAGGTLLQGVPRDLILKTARECETEFSGVRVSGIDRYSQVEFTYRTEQERDGFTTCLQDRAHQRIKTAMEQLAPGQPVPADDGSRETSIPILIRGGLILLPATANGRKPLTLLLDTGASKTILRPSVATRLGIAPSASAPRWPSQLADGRTIVVPYTRLPSIELGSLTVKDLDVGVYDILPDQDRVDGILGGDVLGHFRMSIDRQTERLELMIRPE